MSLSPLLGRSHTVDGRADGRTDGYKDCNYVARTEARAERTVTPPMQCLAGVAGGMKLLHKRRSRNEGARGPSNSVSRLRVNWKGFVLRQHLWLSGNAS